MAKRVSVDKTLFTVTMLLVFVGLVMVFSASAVMAKERFGSPYNFLFRQFAWAVAGLLAMFILMRIDYQSYKRPVVVFSLLGLTSLLLMSVFLLDRTHNTHRWFRLGSLSFQPSELAKPALILFLAYFLDSRVKQMDDWRRTLLPAVTPTVILAGLIVLQPDLGTAVACVAITAAILYVAGMRLKYFAYALAPVPILFWILVLRVKWRYQRILAFMDPYSDPLGRGFHVIQSLIAVGTGGLAGLGLMEGKQKLFFLPEPHTDFIFAVIGEEFGLLGAICVVVLFATFLYRGLRTAVLTRDPFGRHLAAGIASMIVIQALFNMSVVLAMVPTKGIPLPFISYGGSSLFVMLASVGVLLNISKQVE
ncbi:MAG TPA: putative lipid II flippase FtsW [Terriglobales bacterium]|nr:putative lipid II flippase FtsW [Terriglobales bacterium]